MRMDDDLDSDVIVDSVNGPHATGPFTITPLSKLRRKRDRDSTPLSSSKKLKRRRIIDSDDDDDGDGGHSLPGPPPPIETPPIFSMTEAHQGPSTNDNKDHGDQKNDDESDTNRLDKECTVVSPSTRKGLAECDSDLDIPLHSQSAVSRVSGIKNAINLISDESDSSVEHHPSLSQPSQTELQSKRQLFSGATPVLRNMKHTPRAARSNVDKDLHIKKKINFDCSIGSDNGNNSNCSDDNSKNPRHNGPVSAHLSAIKTKNHGLNSFETDFINDGSSSDHESPPPIFTIGEVVWGKLGQFPWWPATVSKLTSRGVMVAWFGDPTHSHLPTSAILRFRDDSRDLSIQSEVSSLFKDKKWSKAYNEALKAELKFNQKSSNDTIEKGGDNEKHPSLLCSTDKHKQPRLIVSLEDDDSIMDNDSDRDNKMIKKKKKKASSASRYDRETLVSPLHRRSVRLDDESDASEGNNDEDSPGKRTLSAGSFSKHRSRLFKNDDEDFDYVTNKLCSMCGEERPIDAFSAKQQKLQEGYCLVHSQRNPRNYIEALEKFAKASSSEVMYEDEDERNGEARSRDLVGRNTRDITYNVDHIAVKQKNPFKRQNNSFGHLSNVIKRLSKSAKNASDISGSSSEERESEGSEGDDSFVSSDDDT